MADGKIVYEVEIDDSGVVREAEAAGEKAGSGISTGSEPGRKRFEEAMIGAARRVGEAFVNMAARAVKAVADFVGDSIRAGREFEASMSQIAATLGLSADDIAQNIGGAGDAFEKLKAKAKEMGKTTSFTAKEAAEALNILAMSGYDAEASIAMVGDVLNLAGAGTIDLASAAAYVTGAIKGFSDSAENAQYYTDLMAKGATLANTNVQQLGDALSGSAATASAYGQTAEATTLALLRLAEQGETGSAAATALSAAMKNLYAPTEQAKSAMKDLRVSAFDPLTGKARDINAVVNDLQKAMAGYSQEQQVAYAQTIFGIQGFDAYNKMVVTSIDTQTAWTEALQGSSGEAAQQYATMMDNLEGDVTKLNSALDGAKIAIAEGLDPALRTIVQSLTDVVSWLTEHETAATVLASAIGTLTAAIIAYNASLALAASGMTLAGIAAGGLAAVMAFLTSPITLVILAIGAMIAAGVLMVKHWDEISAFFVRLWDGITNVFHNAVDAIGRKLSSWWESIKRFFSDGIKAVIALFNLDWASIGVNIVRGIWDGIKGMWPSLVDAVTQMAQELWGSVKNFFGIASPSKKFKWIGEMNVEGIEQGFDEELPTLNRQVRTQLAEVGDSAKAGLADGLESASLASVPTAAQAAQYVDLTVSGTSTGRPTQTNVTLEVDGREIARATAWDMGEQLAWREA